MTPVTPSDKVALRLGALFLAAIALIGVLPLAYFSTFVLDFSQVYPAKFTLLSATWLILAAVLVAGILCELQPTPRRYLAVVSSDALVILLWGGWLAWGLSSMP